MRLKIIYQDKNVLAIDKPAGIVVFPENKISEKTLIDYLLEKYPTLKKAGQPPRYGIVHRLDKDTSGILLIAKNSQSLNFLQKQFRQKRVVKKYLALTVGEIKEREGKIETLIGRSPQDRRKQKVYSHLDPDSKRKRTAITRYKVLKKFKDYTLVEASPETGRKHQIRTHFSYLNHPLAGDKLYGFKNQICPKNLRRQFLHATYLKIKLANHQEKEFKSGLPSDLNQTLKNLNSKKND